MGGWKDDRRTRYWYDLRWYPRVYLERLRNRQKTIVRIVNIAVKIRTWSILNMAPQSRISWKFVQRLLLNACKQSGSKTNRQTDTWSSYSWLMANVPRTKPGQLPRLKTRLFLHSLVTVRWLSFLSCRLINLVLKQFATIEENVFIYEPYSKSKYCLRIFPPQRWGCDFAHARCLPSFIGKPQTATREKQIVFTYCSVHLKCSRWSSAPPTVKYSLLSVFWMQKMWNRSIFIVRYVKWFPAVAGDIFPLQITRPFGVHPGCNLMDTGGFSPVDGNRKWNYASTSHTPSWRAQEWLTFVSSCYEGFKCCSQDSW